MADEKPNNNGDEINITTTTPSQKPSKTKIVRASDKEAKKKNKDPIKIIRKKITDNTGKRQFKVTEFIAGGSFGCVYEGRHLSYNNKLIAIKFEEIMVNKITPHLDKEFSIYEQIYKEILSNADIKHKKWHNFPKIFWYGDYDHLDTKLAYRCLMMSRLGPSLKDIFNWTKEIRKKRKTFSIGMKSVLVANLAVQLFYLVEGLHHLGWLHLDIKPENLCLGIKPGYRRNFYLIDFGTARTFKDKKGHVKPGQTNHIVGTCRYAAVRMHYGYVQSRRDDLETIGWVLMYCFYGGLPWQGITNLKDYDPEVKWCAVRRLKKQVLVTNELFGTDRVDSKVKFPKQLADYFNYVKALRFTTKPDYHMLRAMFRGMYKDYESEDEEKNFIWETTNEYKMWEKLINLKLEEEKKVDPTETAETALY